MGLLQKLIFIAFYRWVTRWAVTQTVQILQLGPSHILYQLTVGSVIQTVAVQN
jgi:hypothetical protein